MDQILVENLTGHIFEIFVGYYIALIWAGFMLTVTIASWLISNKINNFKPYLWVLGFILGGHILGNSSSVYTTATFILSAALLGILASNIVSILTLEKAEEKKGLLRQRVANFVVILKNVMRAIIVFAIFSNNYWYELLVPETLRFEAASADFGNGVNELYQTTIFSKVDWLKLLTNPNAKWVLIAAFAIVVFLVIKKNWTWLKTKATNFGTGFKKGFWFGLNFFQTLPGRISNWWVSRSWWTGKKQLPVQMKSNAADAPEIVATSNLDTVSTDAVSPEEALKAAFGRPEPEDTRLSVDEVWEEAHNMNDANKGKPLTKIEVSIN